MKTPALYHSFFKSALLSPLILAQLILSATPEIAFSEDVENPFVAGTEVLILTDEQKTDLKQYVESTSARLREALENAKGKGFSEQNSIYLEAIVLVVLESNADNNRSQLLTRFALNQALQLTFGTPLPNGLISKGQGILENMANPELLTVILEDSIQLAINYCPDDLNAIDALKVQDANQLLDLPYDKFAHSRLQLARKWLSSTLDIEASYALSVTAFSHWLSSMNRKDQLHRKKYAVEISRANKIVESEMPTKVIQKNIPKDILIGKVRVLRGELRKLAESLSTKTALSTEKQESTKKDPSPFAQVTPLKNSDQNIVAINKVKMLKESGANTPEVISAMKDALSNLKNAEDFLVLARSYRDNPSYDYIAAINVFIRDHVVYFKELRPNNDDFYHLKCAVSYDIIILGLIEMEADLATAPTQLINSFYVGFNEPGYDLTCDLIKLAQKKLDRFLQLSPSQKQMDEYTEIMKRGYKKQ